MASGFTGFFGQTYQDVSTDNNTNNPVKLINASLANNDLTSKNFLKPLKCVPLTCKQISEEVVLDNEIKWKNSIIHNVYLIAQVKEIIKDQNNLVVAVVSDGSSSIILQHFLNNEEESNVRSLNTWITISGKIGAITQNDQKIFSVTAWGATIRKIEHPMQLVQGRILALNNLLDKTKG
jgi:hypothetical protein